MKMGQKTMIYRFAAAVAVLVIGAANSASAQSDLSVPPIQYFQTKALLHEGEYNSALRAFQTLSRSSIRSTEGLWVDSICYQTMLGECYYRMGDTTRALEQFNAALQLAVFHNNWLLRVEFPDTLEPSASVVRSTITWGVSKRNAPLARISDRMASLQGRADNEQVLQQGGVVANPQLFMINVKEIVRCTALALQRRKDIMGPICPHDPFTTQLLAAFSRRPTRPNHWSQSWISCHLGIVYASADKDAQAVSELQKAIVVGGQYDHELTPIALLELGKLALAQENYTVAMNYFLEATYSAAAFDQYQVLTEAFQGCVQSHLLSGQNGFFAPLAPAAAWARRHSRALQAELLLLGAENYAAIGDTVNAASALSQTRTVVGNREMQNSGLGARFNYQSALVNFQRGNLTAANNDFAAAMKFEKNSAKWLLQIGYADRLAASGTVSARVADMMYASVLREPTPRDWAIDPMGTLAVSLTPQEAAMQRWFEIAMGRKEFEKALVITDRIRRHRFYSSLPMGGRQLALRWILEAPEAALDDKAVLRQKDLRARFAAYTKLSDQAAGIRQELLSLPLRCEAVDQARQQEALFEQLATVSTSQEVIIGELALRREPAEFVFPPLLELQQIQAKLNPRQLILSYFVTPRGIHVFAISDKNFANWQVADPRQTLKDATELLRQLGLSEKRVALDSKILDDKSWQATSENLLKGLTNEMQAAAWGNFDEVIIVPDGFLWYVPFEALQVNDGGRMRPLIAMTRLRYVPTASLASPDGRGFKTSMRTAIVTGRMYPGQDPEATAYAYDDIRLVLPGSHRFADRLPAASSYVKAVTDRLVVLADLDDSSRAPYAWSPMQLDQGKPGGSLQSWMTLPWGNVEQVVLPSFHTPAETAMRQGTSGNELFLTSCALMAGGARSVLISRWTVGGQSTFDLVREYVQELPYTSANAAWQRSVRLIHNNQLDAELEPRVNASSVGNLKARHPFFWAGYMVIDSGVQPKPDAGS